MTVHTETFVVEWADTDAGGRIHHTAALRWAEVLEQRYYRGAGITDVVANLPRRRLEVTFHRPLRYTDTVTMQLAVERVGTTSVSYTWRGHRGDGELAVDGRTVAVSVDDGGRAVPLPDHLRGLLEAGTG